MTLDSTPWASGPAEILKHALSLLKIDSDTNRRLAMILIDNAVELMIKTYLGLPKRVTGLQISKTKFEDMSASFPKLLDGLEEYAADKIYGVNLGEIEWYHRLRNELYHQGNGLTVERTKVDVYAELANTLFLNLFGFPLIPANEDSSQLLGKFMQNWIKLEQVLGVSRERSQHVNIAVLVCKLREGGRISKSSGETFSRLFKIKNDVVHGRVKHQDVINEDLLNQLTELQTHLKHELDSTKNIK